MTFNIMVLKLTMIISTKIKMIMTIVRIIIAMK